VLAAVVPPVQSYRRTARDLWRAHR